MQLNDLVQRCKTVLQPTGMADDDLAFAVSQASFPALEELGRRIAATPRLRHFFQTDPTTVTVTLNSSGVADLSSVINTHGILLDCLQYGEIFPPVNEAYPTQPFRLVEGRQQGLLSGMFDNMFLKAWLEGDDLYTKSPTNNVEPLTGNIGLKVSYVPSLDEVPDALSGMLVDLVLRRLRATPEVTDKQPESR